MTVWLNSAALYPKNIGDQVAMMSYHLGPYVDIEECEVQTKDWRRLCLWVLPEQLEVPRKLFLVPASGYDRGGKQKQLCCSGSTQSTTQHHRSSTKGCCMLPQI